MTINQKDPDAQALFDFLSDVKRLDPIEEEANRFNIFDVFGFARNEIRHSFFLKWLLEPKGNHGMGSAFIKALITRLVTEERERYGDLVFKFLMADCSDFTVQREMRNMDLFLCSKSNKVVITIENKIGSHEHRSGDYESQLTKYKDFVEGSFPSSEGWTKIYVYLTPDGDSASDEDTWQSLSYGAVADVIEEILKDNRSRLADAAILLIQNYIDIVRRDIVENDKLKKLCNDIYQAHRKALDLIYEHSEMGMSQVERIVVAALKELRDEGKIIYGDNDRVSFHTQAMSSFLPDITGEKSSWNDRFPYRYWFKINEKEEQIQFVFELGGWGADTQTKTRFNGLINVLPPRKSKDIVRFKRLGTKEKWVKISVDDEEKSKDAIKAEVESVLEKERAWIDASEKYIATE